MIAGSTQPRPRTRDELISPELSSRLDRLDVRSRKVFQGALPGERRSKRRGRSVEFDDYRTYVAGDDLRHIDWNVYARLDRLFIKLFREEEDLALHILIDCSASMDAGNPSKLIFAHRLAMALGYLGLASQNRVSVMSFATREGVRTLAPIDPDYCEHYTGPMVQRDCAYHNGTVWPWLLGAMCEADLRVHSFDADSRARTIDRVCGLVEEMDRASIGSIAEIYDAEPGEDGHHAARGCPSQAWSIAEPLRVLVLAVRGG